jgi:hypothetical protein
MDSETSVDTTKAEVIAGMRNKGVPEWKIQEYFAGPTDNTRESVIAGMRNKGVPEWKIQEYFAGPTLTPEVVATALNEAQAPKSELGFCVTEFSQETMEIKRADVRQIVDKEKAKLKP